MKRRSSRHYRKVALPGQGSTQLRVEPLPVESPLWEMPNVIITPHVSPGRDRMGHELVNFWCDNIQRFAEGRPLRGIINSQARY